MNDTPVLNVRSLADTDGFDISTKHSPVKHTGVLSQANIPDDCGVACHKSGSFYARLGTEKFFEARFDIH
jgi:hypothetical protein